MSGGVSSGRALVGVSSPGVAGGENNTLDTWTPAYHGFKAWNEDPGNVGANGAGATGTGWAIRVFCPTAFTLSQVGFFVGATIGTPTNELTTTNTNSTDITTLVGGQNLAVGANTFTAGPGQFTCATTSPAGFAVITYASGGGTGTLANCQTRYSSTGTLGAGATIRQSTNIIGVYNDAGTTMIGCTADQVTNWGTAGYGGAAGAAVSLNINNGVSASIAAGTYLWVFYVTTATTPTQLRGAGNNSSMPNVGIAVGGAYSNFRIAKVTAGTHTSIPATLTSPVNNSANAYTWFGLL